MITCLALSAALDVTYLLDHLELGAIHRPLATLKLPGGKALNVARALVSLGESAQALVVLGGHTGRLVEHLLIGSGVEVHAVDTADETRTCVTIVSSSESEDAITEVYEPATLVTPSAFREVERLVAALDPREDSWLVLSGSVPAELDLAHLGRMLSARREAGIRIAIDTHGTALDALIDTVHPDLVKVNRVEATALLGESPDAALEVLAAGIRERSGGLVIVTDGADGSLALGATDSPGGDTAVRTVGVKRLGSYPVGSGDCFLAGFLFATVQGHSLEQALAAAATCASANAAVPGAALFDPR
jgi:1-phosphofructokinase family hexose kinase